MDNLALSTLLEEAAEHIAPLGRMNGITASDLGKRLRQAAKGALAEYGRTKHRAHLEDERKAASQPKDRA